jgi:DNA-3-methyladenine glycosylase I
LFKKTFTFTGGEITGEFLLSIGYLPGAHQKSCPAYRQIVRLKPPWMAKRSGSSQSAVNKPVPQSNTSVLKAAG